MDTRRLALNPRAGANSACSYLMGLSFAAGWSPCIGPFLGAILSLSVTAETMWVRLGLLLAYVLGLGVPFLLLALLTDRMTPALARLKPHMRAIEIVSGLLLITIGVVMIGGQLSQLSAVFARTGLSAESLLGLGADGSAGVGAAPAIAVAALAGVLSFASPCVLPLLPAYVGYMSGVAVNTACECK